MKKYKVAILGATGAVGREMMKVLAERDFPIEELHPLASARSVGQAIHWKGHDIPVELACDEAVVRQYGRGARAPYALALVGMAEQHGGFRGGVRVLPPQGGEKQGRKQLHEAIAEADARSAAGGFSPERQPA